MPRNLHHRTRDHFGSDLDTNIQINGAIGTYPSGTSLHTVLSGSTTSKVGLNFVMDGRPATIVTGVQGYVEVPFAATITAVRLFANVAGSVVVDIWKDTYANYPPTVADTITASAKPTLSSAQKYQDSTLTGWTTTINAGDVLGFNVDSLATISILTVSLTLQRR